MSRMLSNSLSAREIISSQSVVTYFQPILCARQRSIIGAEALSRGVIGVEALSRGTLARHNEGLIAPKQLFGMAAEEGLTLELEKLCRTTAIRTFAEMNLPQDLILFLNFDAAALEQAGSGIDDLLADVRRHGLDPRSIAIEILESAFTDTQALRSILDQFRQRGFLLVLDDVGAGHSNLDRIPLIKPDILKLDRSLVVGIENDYYRQETLKSLVLLSRRIGALVVAEGIENEQQAVLAMEAGADLLQGFFLGVPDRAGAFAASDAPARVEQLARNYKAHMIRRINQRKLQHRQFTIILNEILCELSKGDVTHFEDVLRSTVAEYPKVECVYVLDESGAQITSTVCNPKVKPSNKGAMFRPAPRGADHSLKEYYYVLLDVELHKYTTDPYISLASGNLCRTISTCFRDSLNNKMYILCIDVLCD